ncbi:hypothetical protein GWI33_001676 [Rhynchophorus ferrugineus]|uniref:Uncharacterized protein n=1 Tax=Rhynchophorus ferrugineus TaxID=354439 RepID=A0A834MLR1_RHYFE|nr:hypothetical protein GWI33_001676 [Rhynchophorus ferrugineus]
MIKPTIQANKKGGKCNQNMLKMKPTKKYIPTNESRRSRVRCDAHALPLSCGPPLLLQQRQRANGGVLQEHRSQAVAVTLATAWTARVLSATPSNVVKSKILFQPEGKSLSTVRSFSINTFSA